MRFATRLALFLAPLLAACTAAGFTLHRIARTPIAPYGDFGAAWLEHEARLHFALQWRDHAGAGLWERILAGDGQYPPLLHFVTLGFSRWTGYRVEDVAWTGLLWLALLAAAVAACAWAITRSSLATSAAATLVFLWPTGPAVATRYYYDLPLTAVLWVTAAVALAGWDGASPLDRRWRRVPRFLAQLVVVLPFGALVGLLAAIACGFKWTALAFAPLMVGAAFLCPVHRDGLRWRLPVRLLGLGVATALGCYLLWTVGLSLGERGSLAITLNDMWPGVGTELYKAEGLWSFDAARQAMPPGGASDSPLRGMFYPLTLITAVLSPLFAATLAGPLVHWVRRDRRGAPFVLGVVGGQMMFLTLVISSLDERFLLTLAPAVLLAAAVGWSTLDPTRRTRWGALVIAAALCVSTDFHYGDDLPWATPVDVRIPGADTVRIRGLGLGDSWEQRGWARLDSQANPRVQARAMLWSLMHQCGYGPEALRNADSGSTPFGERDWLDYGSMLEALGHPPVVPEIDDCQRWTDALGDVDDPVGDVLLAQRVAVQLLDGDTTPLPVRLQGCIVQAFPGGAPATPVSMAPARLLELRRRGPACLTVSLDRSRANR